MYNVNCIMLSVHTLQLIIFYFTVYWQFFPVFLDYWLIAPMHEKWG